MKRKWLLVPVALATLAGGAYLCWPARSPAGAGDPAPAVAPAGETTALPVARVLLFSSGVGFFQREGTVEGSARVDLAFPAHDVNDLLKSLTAQDLDGGLVTAVSYDTDAPLAHTLQSFAVNLDGNPPLAQILDQARGEKVEAILQQTNVAQPGTLTGNVVGVEHHVVMNKDGASTDGLQLNLWCADGVHSIKLAEVQRLRFLNPVIESEFRKALETLAKSHDSQKRGVSLTCTGEGKRHVRVGYVVENPIWKTSYRLSLGDAKAKTKTALQGWALVENTTDEDWRDVGLGLVSGRPISFRMDLYTPLYVSRPLVVPELFASLQPPTYSGNITLLEQAKQPSKPAAGFGGRQLKDMADERAAAAPALMAAQANLASEYRKGVDGARMDLAQGVQSAASTAKLGDNFQYTLDHAVNLPRQKSAMLPIVQHEVAAERLSIYRETTHAKFPLLGVRFHNATALHLMQGPVTLYDGGAYAGDARLPDLQPDEKRLLSYAVDLGTEVSPRFDTDNGRLVNVKAVKGVLYTSSKRREAKTYTIANRNDQDRIVLIEHPVRGGFNIVDTEKPVETAADVYRFEVNVPAGKTGSLKVTEERDEGSTVQLVSNNMDEQIRFFTSSPVVSDKVKAGLHKAQQLRWALAKTEQDEREEKAQLDALVADQTRLRANLHEVPAGSANQKRYLEKLDKQETEFEQRQTHLKQLQAVVLEQKKTFEDFLVGFSAE